MDEDEADAPCIGRTGEDLGYRSPGRQGLEMVSLIIELDIDSLEPWIMPTVLQRSSQAALPGVARLPVPARYIAPWPALARRPEPCACGSSNAVIDPAGDVRHCCRFERTLTTLLFTDIVGATETASALGDRRWRELLDQHHALVRREIARFRGREVDNAGDAFFATFDGPARAVDCACDISNKVHSLGLAVRAGLHTGECEMIGEKPGGIAVHIASRIVSQAAADEVLVSSTVKDVVAGSEILFEDLGTTGLKGVPGEWRLFSVKRSQRSVE